MDKEQRLKKIYDIEPRLKELDDDISKVKDDENSRYFCSNEVWYHQFKPRLIKLVGWMADRSQLISCEDYDLVYRHLSDKLPDCRDCGGLKGGGKLKRSRFTLTAVVSELPALWELALSFSLACTRKKLRKQWVMERTTEPRCWQ